MIYFDNAATSRYKPKVVKNAIADAIRHSANPGRGSHDEAIRGAMTVGRTRDDVLRFVKAKRANVVFTKNCTEALNIGILGTVRPGDHVVTTVLEHNSVLRPLYMLKKEGLITLSVVEGDKGRITANDVAAAIEEKTYLVAITAMSNVTGYAPPLGEIGELCAEKGVKLLVDGAQALGHLPLCVDKIGKPKDPPESLEAGTLNLPGIAALGAGVRWTEANFEKIRKKEAELSTFLHEEVAKTGYRVYSVAGSPILSFALPSADSQTIADVLNQEYGIAVRAGLHCAPLIHKTLGTDREGLVRVSIGCKNTLKEAKRLLFALKEIKKHLTK